LKFSKRGFKKNLNCGRLKAGFSLNKSTGVHHK
jgi:hypothetical protein